MESKIFYLNKIPGFAGRCNDILYSSPLRVTAVHRLIVFFGGDVQDLKSCMEKHNDSKRYLMWSLENTLSILSKRFPQSHIMIVRPSRMEIKSYAVFSCYDNFVPGDEYGVPSFKPNNNALLHLSKLLRSVLTQVSQQVRSVVWNFDILGVNLTLMAFSKGCVVLNQFLHEFHHIQNQENLDENLKDLTKRIKDIWWLDGGHAGTKDTWINDKRILESFAKLGIKVYVYVTPYQVNDKRRPWIKNQENLFCKTLQELHVPVQRTLHFKEEKPSLTTHFNVLTVIKDIST
ncbi:UPF0565 protein C2orf69 homolog isoform X3 [Cephus cinctus]|uniref:UPF0565 protein C2orf69 homolog isoform X3 n=1 Tax=Cephus cinctus TaxID=211228 RepID=A0AAJ7RF10_CEPCN|nr:UPF0565 protein C2orf69 homolog isoform X3 [Cephus cinctus]